MNKEMNTSQFSKIKRMFELQSEDHKELGSYINLATIIKGRNYKRSDVFRAFNQLVSKEDYDIDEKLEYQNYLCQITMKQK